MKRTAPDLSRYQCLGEALSDAIDDGRITLL